MLASITPLGERSRGFSWRLTASAFAAGSLCAGAAGGALVGALGGLVPLSGSWRGAVLLAALLLAAAFEISSLRASLPSTRRQVNEDWLSRYRGWVYGLAFGAQLGVGVVTIVGCAAIYATVLAALLSGSAAAGVVIGASFGAVRALSLLLAARARDAASLHALHRRLAALEPHARRATPVVELALVALAIMWLA